MLYPTAFLDKKQYAENTFNSQREKQAQLLRSTLYCLQISTCMTVPTIILIIIRTITIMIIIIIIITIKIIIITIFTSSHYYVYMGRAY